jgi:hypothetical protein
MGSAFGEASGGTIVGGSIGFAGGGASSLATTGGFPATSSFKEAFLEQLTVRKATAVRPINKARHINGTLFISFLLGKKGK